MSATKMLKHEYIDRLLLYLFFVLCSSVEFFLFFARILSFFFRFYHICRIEVITSTEILSKLYFDNVYHRSYCFDKLNHRSYDSDKIGHGSYNFDKMNHRSGRFDKFCHRSYYFDGKMCLSILQLQQNESSK